MFPILLGKNNDLEKRVKTLEDSGGGGGSTDTRLIVTIDPITNMADKKAKEIIDKYPNVVFSWTAEDVTQLFLCDGINIRNPGIVFTVDNTEFGCETENDYPQYLP